jgi:hypothetical protein
MGFPMSIASIVGVIESILFGRWVLFGSDSDDDDDDDDCGFGPD